MKILVICQPLNNRGDESAHRGFMHRLLSRYPSAEVKVFFLSEPMSDIRHFDVGAENVVYEALAANISYFSRRVLWFEVVSLAKKGVPYGILRLLWKINPSLRRVEEEMKASDLVVVAPGGTCLGGLLNMQHLFMMDTAVRAGVRLAYFGRSVGPFRTDNSRQRYFNRIAIPFLKSFTPDNPQRFISLRDRVSMEQASKIGFSAVATVDSAFLEEPVADISACGLKDPYMVFVPNDISSYVVYQNTLGHEDMFAFWLKVLNHILDQRPEEKIVMLPQLFNQGRANDLPYFRKIAQSCSDPSRVKVFDDNLTSDEQQTIIRGAKSVVGARYHSIVFSVNNETPFVAFSYEHKISGLLKVLGLEDRFINIESRFEDPAFREEVFEAFKEKFAELPQVKVSREEAVKIASEGFDRFVEWVGGSETL